MTESIVLSDGGFKPLSFSESMEVNGGWLVAAVYALGFVMGMTPLGALVVCAVVVVAAVTAGILVSKYG